VQLLDEAQGWRELLARHGPALVLFARQWRPRVADAEDAVQEGFVRFWKARDRSRDELAYLYACVRAAAIDAARADAARVKRDEVSADVDEALAFLPEQDELAEQVEAALSRLPDEQREVVVMKIWGGATFAQIADALQISSNTAASRYRYAIEKLESELAEYCPELRKSAQ